MLKELIFARKSPSTVNRRLTGVALDPILKYLEPTAKSLDGATIAISGASGFIGTWIVESLIQISQEFDIQFDLHLLTREIKNLETRAYDLSSNIRIKLCQVDLSLEIPNLPECSHVIHAASPTQGLLKDEDNPFRINTRGLSNFIEGANNKNKKVRVLNCSSGAVYGRRYLRDESIKSDELMNEDSRSRDFFNEYSLAKIQSERIVSDLTSQNRISGINMRLFAFYGPLLPLTGKYAIGNFLKSCAEKSRIYVQSSGESIRSYQHASHLCAQIIYLLTQQIEGEIDIGSLDSKSIAWWANYVGELFNVEVNIANELPEIPTVYVPRNVNSLPRIVETEESREIFFREWFTWIQKFEPLASSKNFRV